jgi:hypothetical protein
MTLRSLLIGVVCVLAFGGASVAPASASAAVRDCSWNLVRAKPLGTYLTVTSVRNMSCSKAKRTARRARLGFSPARMRLSGWSCVHTSTAGAQTDDPMPEFRCTRGGRAFRATARP